MHSSIGYKWNEMISVKATQQLLLQRGVLSYHPSLSAQVYDVLYSYWRLPRATKAELSLRMPHMALHIQSDTSESAEKDVHVEINWNEVATFLEGTRGIAAVTPVEASWAMITQMNHLVTHAMKEIEHYPLDRRRVLPHTAKLPELIHLLDDHVGEYYMAFIILITILEKALYDLHHQNETVTAKADKKKNMILRDLLYADTLMRVLPDGLVRLLKILFLPSGLNLRNLVWHGFLTPMEVSKCFGCLTVVLILTVRDYLKPQDTVPSDLELPDACYFDVHTFDDRFVTSESMLKLPLSERELELTLNSSFIPKGRVNLVRRALTAFITDRDELWFLFALLPVFEHAMRIEFVRANQARWGISGAYGQAQIDAYYSTLDGFGQKHKHQVLLHPIVVPEQVESKDDSSCDIKSISEYSPIPMGEHRLNALYTAIPIASLSVCLDLFMMASGPNLRAKLCHGEADLSTLLASPESKRPVSTASQLFFLAWLLVCDNTCKDSRNSDTDSCLNRPSSTESPTTSAIQSLQSFQECYSCSFHPYFQLHRALGHANELVFDFSAFRASWTTCRLEEITKDSQGESQKWIEFPLVNPFKNGTKFGLIEKSSRLAELHALVDGSTATIDKKSPASVKLAGFPALLVQLRAKLNTVIDQIQSHLVANHQNSSVFLPMKEKEADSPCTSDTNFSPLSCPFDRELERYILALSDHDGLSVAACMMESITSSQRALKTFCTRFIQLQQLIYESKARTNHRRSFLNSIFFMPVFEQVHRSCLALVEHQVMCLLEKALYLQQEESEIEHDREEKKTSLDYGCSKSVAFEQVQRKLLQFITAFEGCTGSTEASQKSGEKALQLTLQFLDSKAVKALF